MSSRRNFLDADNSIMERNLRFVKNDLEENLNQYFGGSGGRGNNSTTVSAPPRDYKVVQPKPGGSHALGLEKRRGFLLQLGLARHEAYELAKNTNFDVNRYEGKCQRWLDNGFRKEEVINEILCDIRNENNYNNNVVFEDEFPSRTPPVPSISTNFEEMANFNRHGHEHNVETHEILSQRNRSRSRSRPNEPSRNYHKVEYYHTPRSHSPRRNFCSLHERSIEGGEYFSQQVNFRDDVERHASHERYRPRAYSPPRFDYKEITTYLSRSRSPNRAFNAIHTEGRNEEYFLQHKILRGEQYNAIRKRSRSFSPSRNDRREERRRYLTSGSCSPNRDFRERKAEDHFLQYDNYRDDVRKDTFSQQSRNRSFSPIISERGHETYQTSRAERYQQPFSSHSPNRSSCSMLERKREEFLLNYDYSKDEVKKDIIHECSRSYSPNRYDRRREHYQPSRSRSPHISQHKKCRDISERYHSRPYSPARNDHREEIYQSSRSRSPNRGFDSFNRRVREDIYSQQNYQDDRKRDKKHFKNSKEHKFANTQKGPSHPILGADNNKIPSLLEINVFSNQNQTSNEHFQNPSIPSLLSLQVFPDKNDFQHSSTSKKKGNRHDIKSNRKKTEQAYKKPTKFESKEKNQQNNKNNKETNCNVDLKQPIANIPIIQSGLKKPPPGHLKANPKDYWSQWWPQYKYIEYSLPKIDPNDNEIQNCINFKFNPHEFECRRRRHLLLTRGVKIIMKTLDINETNYYLRDIYKLFQYKKHLEDPSFQNSLAPEELNCIAPALRQFQIKSTMAFLHQALIVKWHVSLDIIKKVQAGERIMSNYARLLLNEKCFHYLVKESFQELKKMCQQDWPQFNEFYKKLKAKKIDIYALGVGPNLEINSNKDNLIYRNDDESGYNDKV